MFNRRYEITLIEEINKSFRTWKAQPLQLGGVSGPGGGDGGPPGGIVGQLPQTRVAYDETEAASFDTPATGILPPSGRSLLDNLNHIRARLSGIEASGILIVTNEFNSPYIDPTTEIVFSGASVQNLGGGVASVSFEGGTTISNYTSITLPNGINNNWNDSTFSTDLVFLVTAGGGTAYISGIDSTARDGKVLRFINVGSDPFYILNEYSSSSAINRIKLPYSIISIKQHESISLWYDTVDNRWKVLSTGNNTLIRDVAGGVIVGAPSSIEFPTDSISVDTFGKVSVDFAPPLTVEEIDGSPSIANVTTIQVSNGTLTDMGGGTARITISGTGGGTTASGIYGDDTVPIFYYANFNAPQEYGWYIFQRDEPYWTEPGTGGYHDTGTLTTGNDQYVTTISTKESDFLGAWSLRHKITARLALYTTISRQIALYAKIYYIPSDGYAAPDMDVPVLIGTTDVVPFVQNFSGHNSVDLNLILDENIDNTPPIDSKSRIVVEIYTNISGSGADGYLRVSSNIENGTILILNTDAYALESRNNFSFDGVQQKFYLTGDSSDISGYHVLSPIPPTASGLLVSPFIDNSDYVEAYDFITASGTPNMEYLLPGLYHTRFWVKRDTLTQTSAQIFGVFFKRASDGTETDLSWSEYTQDIPVVTSGWMGLDLHFAFNRFYPLASDSSDRLGLRLFVNTNNIDGSGGTIDLATNKNSGMEIMTEASHLPYFQKIHVPSQSDINATLANHTLNITVTSGLSISTNASTNTLTLSSTGGGGGGDDTDAIVFAIVL